MKHKRLIIITTILVFVMVCVLSLKELFSVRDITVIYSVTSTEATEEVLTLLDKYKGKNIFAINTKSISDEITANRYLKVNSVEKNYPNELIINLSERVERYYYVAPNSEIYFFDEEYFVVRKANELLNEGEILTQISFEHINGDKVEANCQLKSAFSFPNGKNADVGVVMQNTTSVSGQIKTITFTFTPEEGNYRILLEMKEGASIEIRWAGERLAEKIQVGVEYYLSLEEARKIEGLVYVQTEKDGSVKAYHTFNG